MRDSKALDAGVISLAGPSPLAFRIARPKQACQNVPPERLLSADEVGRRGARTRPLADNRTGYTTGSLPTDGGFSKMTVG